MGSEHLRAKGKPHLWMRLPIVLPFLWGVIGTIVFILIVQVNRAEEQQIAMLKKSVVSDAISHFDDMVAVRRWNASHNGVFVKQHGTMQPNPYLKENLITCKENEKMIKINPAWMTREIAQISNLNRQEHYKLTSLIPINPLNTPNTFETDAMKYLQKNRSKTYYYRFGEEQKFQFVGALYFEKGCMGCHGEMGYRIGDVRGGISIELPLEKFKYSKHLVERHTREVQWGIGILGLIVGTLLSFLAVSMLRHHKHLHSMNEELEEIVRIRTNELQELNATLESRVKEEIKKNKIKDEMMILQSRHAAMGEMIGMIAHQWRQPVATLSMVANKMVMDIELDEVDLQGFEKDAEEIIAQAVYLSKTIDDFTDFFKPNKQKEIFSPYQVFEEAVNMIGKGIENKGIGLKIESSTEGLVLGFPHELLQVYLNLLKNAKEACEGVETDSKEISVVIYEAGEWIVTTVCDNGIGVDPSIREEVFVPYFTTKEELNGTGLGLYMSKIIVENHLLGKIKIDDERDRTCFSVWLPRLEG
ncbi:MAG: DUF3365 domain-containing protein [Sulfuricurvum sp.]|jgi:signal transduction histidine kinase|uniref:ATP-binding protein n=1 Tax=Sulfuricurvum sp. TaxID=2025608 RepID=UPI0025CC4B0E|nr:DUF3365 domain-containing protein [Sulfuricurvum sp.]MCK9373140.1 DUF3365 domain-containing protein [Sulfuricurvum sp.]